MSLLKILIFIIFIALLTTEALHNPLKNRTDHLWKEKMPNDPKIIKLAEKSLEHYNTEHNSKFFLDRILKAGKEYVKGLAHYFLKIIGTKRCGNEIGECLELFYANIYDNRKHFDHKLNFSVNTNGNTPTF